MPRKYVPKIKARRRRNYKAKKHYAKRNMLHSFSKAPMPTKFATKLRYSTTVNVEPGAAGVAGVHVMSANGLYNPDITTLVGDHQPRGWDQLMTMYNHATVIGSKITCTFSNVAQSADATMIVGINLRSDTTIETDKNNYMEGRFVTSRVITGGISGNSKQVTLTKKFSNRFLGISKPLASTTIRNAVNANPSEQAFFHCWASPSGSADLSAASIVITIDYLVVFTEPLLPAQS